MTTSARTYVAGRSQLSVARTLTAISLVCSVVCSGAALDQMPPTTTTHTARPRHWFQVGIASWYGAHFQGRKTSTGEIFDMNALTCAHPSLPMGTWVRVTNMTNHRTTFARVNDRGPVTDGRIVDLSFATAQAVGLAGVGRVRLEAVRANDPELGRALLAQLNSLTILPHSPR